MNKPKNILFVTWDGPQTSYMEGLFMPIFHEVTRQDESIRFHVLQFTWATEEKTNAVKQVAQELGIVYHNLPILKKPVASIGSLITLFTGSKKIKKYIQDHQIDIVMPRSTFPAFMVQRIKKFPFGERGGIIFDADGLPIEERVDFAGLDKKSGQYRWLKSIETKMLQNADAVITRSQKAIEVHLQNIGEENRDKFSVVHNGRNTQHFAPHVVVRRQIRKELGVQDELLWVYAGSLGPQYCWEEMLQIFVLSQKVRPSNFLVLTGNLSFAEERIPEDLKDYIMVKSVAFERIPDYLTAADVAFALRRPTPSMQGVAPIKLGEYLLMGLPTIASGGIGDTDEILRNFGECFIFDHDRDKEEQLLAIEDWIQQIRSADFGRIRKEALDYFSLEKAAESYIKVIKKL